MPRVKDKPDHYQCKDCRNIKHNSEYYKDRSSLRGFSYRCKQCSKANALAGKRRNRVRYNAMERERTLQLKKQVYEMYGSKCACCGETETEFLCIDHVNGDGSVDRKTKGTWGGQAFYRTVVAEGFPKDKYQVLCHNCNRSKGTGLYCVHQRRVNEMLSKQLDGDPLTFEWDDSAFPTGIVTVVDGVAEVTPDEVTNDDL